MEGTRVSKKSEESFKIKRLGKKNPAGEHRDNNTGALGPTLNWRL